MCILYTNCMHYLQDWLWNLKARGIHINFYLERTKTCLMLNWANNKEPKKLYHLQILFRHVRQENWSKFIPLNRRDAKSEMFDFEHFPFPFCLWKNKILNFFHQFSKFNRPFEFPENPSKHNSII